MSTFLPVPGNWRCWLGAVAITLATALDAPALDLSGSYAEGGTYVPGSSGNSTDEPSLSALLRLQFSSEWVNMLRDNTSHVRVKHEGSQIKIEVHDLSGAVNWTARWTEGEAYVQKGERVILRFPEPRRGIDEIILILEQVPNHGLLQVSVQRVQATVLGPAARKLGTYLFHLMP
jgi:hypothetical protein